MDKLKPCPFCGSTKLKMEKKSTLAGFNGLDWRVERHTYSVRCNVCHARGGAAGGKVIPHYEFFNKPYEHLPPPQWVTTDEKLREEAAEAWNRRASDARL